MSKVFVNAMLAQMVASGILKMPQEKEPRIQTEAEARRTEITKLKIELRTLRKSKNKDLYKIKYLELKINELKSKML